MIHFENLKFVICPNSKENNTRAEVVLDNGYLLDVIRRPVTRTYIVKPFEKTFDKKWYKKDMFPEYGEFPVFFNKDSLMVFINQIDKHNLSDNPDELDEDLELEL